jgi:PilZ domain
MVGADGLPLAVPTGEHAPAAARMSGIRGWPSDHRHPAQDTEGMTTFNTDRRALPRHEVRKKEGRLLFVDQPCFVECTIRDMSADGALLSTFISVSLPALVLLWERQTGAIHECEVRWRKGRTVGVRFTDVYGRAARHAVLEQGFAQLRHSASAARLH